MRPNACGTEGSTTDCRRQAGTKAPPVLSRDDRQTLRRLAALAGRYLDLLLDGAGRKEVLRSGFDLAEELSCWLGRTAPERLGREAGARP